MAGTYEHDSLSQTFNSLLKEFNEKKLQKLPKQWQQRFKEFKLDENDFIYVHEKLVIPEKLRKPIFRSLHWGHPGRDAMLQAVADIRWPRIHRDVVLLVQSCSQCQQVGKNLRRIIPQSDFGKLPAAEKHNNEIALDIAGPFKLAPEKKKYLLVAIGHKTNRPNAMFVRKPTAERVTNFLQGYLAPFGIPKRIRTDPATIFRGETHIEGLVRHHRIEE